MRSNGWLIVPVLALAPGSWLAWQSRALDGLGRHHDDSLYLVSARSLAESGEYRIESLPGSPNQTKYPPGFPALLAAVWHSAGFPDNLPWVMLACWLGVPVLAALLWYWFRESGVRPEWAALLAASVALNPAVVLLGTSVMSDVWFVALLAGCLLVMQRWPGHTLAALLAGILGGLAYVTRTAALPLALSGPVFYMLHRRRSSAAVFLAGCLPFVAAWSWWSGAHRAPAPDFGMAVYVDYFGIYRDSFILEEVPGMIWTNAWAAVLAMGRLAFFNLSESGAAYFLTMLMGLAACAGILRRAREQAWRCAWFWFGVFYAVMVAVYVFPPDVRLCLPLLPVILAGLFAEGKHIHGLACRAGRARLAYAWAGLVPAIALGLGGYSLAGLLPDMAADDADYQTQRAAAFDWIRSNTARDALFYSFDDPGLFLHTGRRGMTMHVPPRIGRHHDPVRNRAFLEGLPEFALRHGLDYILLTRRDFSRDLARDERESLRSQLDQTPGWKAVLRLPEVTLYRVPRLRVALPERRITEPAGSAIAFR